MVRQANVSVAGLPAHEHKEVSMVTRRLLLAGATVLAATPTLPFRPAVAAEAGSVKTVTIVSRPDDATSEQFIQRLQDEYAPLANKLPGQRGLIISGVVKAQPRDDVKLLQIGSFDAIIESYYSSLTNQERAAASPEGKALDAAMAHLVGTARRFVTRETVIIPLPSGARPQIVGLSFVMRPDSVSEADFRNQWIVEHGPMAKKVPYLRGFTVSQRLSDSPVPGVPTLIMDGPLDGFTESWVDDVDARAKMIASPQAKEWYAHGAEIFGKIRTDLLIEHVMQPIGL
jgi:hypothetical protein